MVTFHRCFSLIIHGLLVVTVNVYTLCQPSKAVCLVMLSLWLLAYCYGSALNFCFWYISSCYWWFVSLDDCLMVWKHLCSYQLIKWVQLFDTLQLITAFLAIWWLLDLVLVEPDYGSSICFITSLYGNVLWWFNFGAMVCICRSLCA